MRPTTKLQRNQLFQLIKRAGLDPASFSPSPDWDQLLHLPTDSLFRFELLHPIFRHVANDLHRALLVPVFRSIAEPLPNLAYEVAGQSHTAFARDWTTTLEEFTAWLEALTDHQLNPDLWEALADSAGTDDTENTPFTAAERVEIHQKLDALLDEVRQAGGLNSDQLAQIEARLDYIKTAAETMGRIDWKNLAMGAILSLMADAYLPPDATRQMLNAIVHAAGQVWLHRHAPGMLPPPS